MPSARIFSPLAALASLAIVGVLAAAHSGGTSTDEEAVRAVLNEYFAGQSSGDGSHYRKIFYPNANLYWINEGKYQERTSAEFISRAGGQPATDETKRKRRIVTVDLTHDAATAKLVTDTPAMRVTDYMSLLKVDGQWVIVAKVFTREPKSN